MGNGGSSDSSSGWELEDEQGPSLCKTFDGYSLLPLEVRVKILSYIWKFKTRMSLLWADRSLYEYCCRHELLAVASVLVSTKDGASVKVSFYEHRDAHLDEDCCGSDSDFLEIHKLPNSAAMRDRARRNVPAPEHCCHMKEVVEKRKRNKLWIRHAAESQREEGIISFKSNQIMVNGSFLRSAHAIGDLDILVLDSPCVPPPNGPPIKCYEVHMHWDFGYLKRLKRQVDIPDLLNKWIDHVQPWREFRVFLYSSSKITKEDLIALFSRNWGNVCIAVNLKKLGIPVDHIGDVIDSIPLATREFSLSVQADKMLFFDPIESQFTKRIQHFIDTKGDYEAEVYIGADFLCIDTSKIRLNLDINFPEFCIAEDGCDEYEYELRVGHAQPSGNDVVWVGYIGCAYPSQTSNHIATKRFRASNVFQSGRYISLEYEREDVDDLSAIRLRVSLCLCRPTLEQTVCRHGFFWCNDELEKKLRRLGI